MASISIRRRRALLIAALASGLSWRAHGAQRPAAAAVPASDARPGAPLRSRYVGINLAGISYWTTEFPFADLVRNSGGFTAWRNGSDQNAGKLETRPDGYPARLESGQTAALAVAWNNTGYPRGAYVIRWEGEGDLAFPLTEGRVATRAPGRIVLEVTKNEGPMFVSIERTRPENPVRNLRFLWPGTEAAHASQPFNTAFLERIAPFSTLRFMDWGRTNHSPVVRWSDRATAAQVTWAEGVGVPLETMVALANVSRANPWLCVPHAADDDYVRAMAALVKEQLDPGLVATIEYSNEVWNSGFRQAAYAVEQARRAGMPAPSGMGTAWYAERTLRIVQIFEQVFGAESRRWRAVVGAQAAWTKFAEEALAWKNTAQKVRALAIAPYFDAGINEGMTADAVLALSPEQLLARMRQSIQGQVRERVAANARLAAKHGLALEAYEAGTHDTSFAFPADKQDPVTARLAQAHGSAGMRAVYREYLETWIASGGELLNHYFDIGAGGKWGFWGVLDRVTQDPRTAPKYLGLLDAIAAHPLAPR